MPDHVYRSGFDAFPGHSAAARLLSKHETFVGAWNELEVCSKDDAEEWLLRPAQIAAGKGEPADRVEGVIQVALQFAMVAVMADRLSRQEEEKNQTHVPNSEEGEQ